MKGGYKNSGYKKTDYPSKGESVGSKSVVGGKSSGKARHAYGQKDNSAVKDVDRADGLTGKNKY